MAKMNTDTKLQPPNLEGRGDQCVDGGIILSPVIENRL
jgi:hypothetical protein